MGNASADGQPLWLSGCFDDVVYTDTGAMEIIPVRMEPLGHTGDSC